MPRAVWYTKGFYVLKRKNGIKINMLSQTAGVSVNGCDNKNHISLCLGGDLWQMSESLCG
jgi:hypothetical protein